MKKYIVLVFVLLATVSLSANELSWVDEQVEAIKPPREGMSNSSISIIDDPFIFLKRGDDKDQKNYTKKKNSTKSYARSTQATTSSSSSSSTLQHSSGELTLNAVINTSALINGKWYKLNDKVSSYKLATVNRTSVILTKGKKKLVLSTNDKKRNLKFK